MQTYKPDSAEVEALRVADEAIAGVRARGDAYVREQIARFDNVVVDDILIEPRNVTIDPQMEEAIELAITRIDAFHRRQLPAGYTWSDNGTEVVHCVQPLRRVGLYVPGGRAVYLSTLIMTAVPARIAGVREMVAITTPAAADRDEQQEHGPDSRVTVLWIGRTVSSIDEAVETVNRIAPEHVSIQTRDPQSVAARIENCGAIFCGSSSPVAAGDYIAGPNHVL